MKYILVIGSGGREHAIVRALTRKSSNSSPRQVIVFGSHLNPGIDRLIYPQLSLFQLNNFYQVLDINDPSKVTEAIKALPESQKPAWAIIGPEKPLANGVVDALEALNIPCIGPNQALAQLECSKIYGRKLMAQDSLLKKHVPRHRIFQGKYQDVRDQILETFDEYNFRFVIKPSELSGGKGVRIFRDDISQALKLCSDILAIPESLSQVIDTNSSTGLIIEEYLEGEEISLMSLSDQDPNHPLLHFPPVQDHKKAYDFDQGPNTGGMGTLSLASHTLPFLTEKDLRLLHRLNTRMMRALAKKYRGIIFGGYLKTKTGEIKILEYNVRFGDPESINILETLRYPSLIELCEATLQDKLTLDIINKVQFTKQHCLVHYVVPRTYPNSEKALPNDKLLDLKRLNKNEIENHLIFASAEYLGSPDRYNLSIRMAGHSRTLAVCVQDKDYFRLLEKGRNLLCLIQGEVRYRFDIGQKFVSYFSKINHKDHNQIQLKIQEEPLTYGLAGVNVNEAERSISLIKESVEKTYNENVLRNFGGFGGLFQIPLSTDLILTTSIDGTGTKSKFLPRVMSRPEALYNLGHDVFFANLNDIIVTAREVKPLFFLDYFSTHTLDAEDVQYYVQGISDACQETETALIGGETAELKTHQPDSYELVGCLIGQVKNPISSVSVYVKEMIKAGHHVLGIKSNGLHTNGYTLINRLMDEELLTMSHIKKYQKELCGNHRNYHPFLKAFQGAQLYPSGLCHITGGGLMDNPKRVLLDHLEIEWESLLISEMPQFYQMLQSLTKVSNTDELFQTYNMGYGFLVFCDPEDTEKYLEMFPDDIRLVGEVKKKKYKITKVKNQSNKEA